MYKINRKLEYSLMALRHMSGKVPGELTTAKEVAETYSIPFDATARALQNMAQNGLLRVEHGAAGGYQITKDLSRVTLHELMNIIEGPGVISKCLEKNEVCDIQDVCNIKSPINYLNTKLADFYRGVVLRDLLQR